MINLERFINILGKGKGMVLKTPEKNSYRDAVYKHLFNDIQKSLAYFKEASRPQKHLWDSEITKEIDEIAVENRYRLYRRNTTVPELYVVGYEQDSIDCTVSFLSGLGENSILQQCAFLAEGYDDEAAMLSKASPVTNPKLNAVLSKYNIKPRGNDLFILRERQYQDLSDGNLPNDAKKVLEIMDCLVQRERDYFLPFILKNKKKIKPMIFLTNMVHVASSTLSTTLNNKEVRYAFFVPNFKK